MILSLVEEADYIAKAVEYNVSGYIIKTDYTLSGVVDQIKIALASSKLKN